MVPHKNLSLFYENWSDKSIMIRDTIENKNNSNNKT